MDLQFDSLVPVDDVSGYGERLDVDDVDVAPFSADVEPLALERQVEAGDSATIRQKKSVEISSYLLEPFDFSVVLIKN
jgi:hypothetical protein